MKGFIAAIITLCLLIGGIIWNGIWINRTLGELASVVESISGCSSDDQLSLCSVLWDRWKDCRTLIAITVSHSEVEMIDSRIVSLTAYARHNESSDFDSTLAQLKEEIEFLHRSESFTIEGII